MAIILDRASQAQQLDVNVLIKTLKVRQQQYTTCAALAHVHQANGALLILGCRKRCSSNAT